MTSLEQVLELPAREPDLSPARPAPPDGADAGSSGRHPVDQLYDYLQRRGGSSDLAQAQGEFDRLGIGPLLPDVMASWTGLNLLTAQGDRICLINTDRVTPDSPVTLACWLPATPPASRLATSANPRPRLALLSLFDGTGLARVALDQRLRAMGPAAPTLVASAFAEIQASLGCAVQRLWAAEATATGCTPHQYIAQDVWDIFRCKAGRTPLHDFADGLPAATTVLIVAGPPCQDLTAASQQGGQRGLCGDRSCHFYAVPIAAWCLQKLRPDLSVHAVVENAGSMRPIYKAEFLRALRAPEHHAQLIGSRVWSGVPRRRIFFSTLPPGQPQDAPIVRRPPPWEDGWTPRWGGEPAPMLCSRAAPGSDIRASTMHYHPKHLIYRHDAPHAWHGGDWARVHKPIGTLVPAHLKASFAALLTGPRRDTEQAALSVIEWIEGEGRQLGFRIPSLGPWGNTTTSRDCATHRELALRIETYLTGPVITSIQTHSDYV